VKELLKSDSIYQSYARMEKGPVFFLTHSIYQCHFYDAMTLVKGVLRYFNDSLFNACLKAMVFYVTLTTHCLTPASKR